MNTTVWRWFPHAMIAALGVVIVVNLTMVYDAYRTFPGVAGRDGFDLSNEYGRVLATAQRQSELGWQIEAEVKDGRFPVLRLTDKAGAPLTTAAIEARAERPVGPADLTTLTFQAMGDGHYLADTSLFSGQWDVLLTVHANGHDYHTTRRLMVQ